MGKADGFESLEAWKCAREFRKDVSRIAKKFPGYEQYRLTDQVTRSVRSVSANISEGYGRYHYKETKQGCRIARGSLMETLDHLIVALDEGYITDAEIQSLRQQYDQCMKLINGYIKYLNGNPGLGDA